MQKLLTPNLNIASFFNPSSPDSTKNSIPLKMIPLKKFRLIFYQYFVTNNEKISEIIRKKNPRLEISAGDFYFMNKAYCYRR